MKLKQIPENTPITRTSKAGPIQLSCILVQPHARLFLRAYTRTSRKVIPRVRKPLKSDASHFGLSTFLKRLWPAEDIQCSVESRCLTIYFRWFCFHVGRPSSLSLKDVAIEQAQDPFIRLLAELCKAVSRSGNEIYGQRHESLLHMWRVARSIVHDLRGLEVHMQQALGFGLNGSIQTGSLGVQQTIFLTCKVKSRHCFERLGC